MLTIRRVAVCVLFGVRARAVEWRLTSREALSAFTALQPLADTS